jgi:cytochrome c5
MGQPKPGYIAGKPYERECTVCHSVSEMAGDLILSKRAELFGRRQTGSRLMVEHAYLCERCFAEATDFMRALGGEEEWPQ